MATLKEWIRDFKKKPKWDKFEIIFAVVIGVIGLFFAGQFIINIFSNNTIDKPEFNMINSSYFGINYKSPNSSITIIDRSNLRESCDSTIYNMEFTGTFEHFFEDLTSEYGPNYKYPNLRYDLFNVKYVLPTKQELFIPEMKSNVSYIIAYFNKDFSDACIVHKYELPKNFDESEVCFIAEPILPSIRVNLSLGPKFISDKESCFRKVSGDFDFIKHWNPNK